MKGTTYKYLLTNLLLTYVLVEFDQLVTCVNTSPQIDYDSNSWNGQVDVLSIIVGTDI